MGHCFFGYLMPKVAGSQSETGGTKVTINTTISVRIMKGKTAAASFTMGSLNSDDATNRLKPKGGVNMPRAPLIRMMMPRCMGSTPMTCAMGRNKGAKMTVTDVGSRNMPATIRIRLIMSSMESLELMTSVSTCPKIGRAHV